MAVELGRRGGKARAARMDPANRSEAARRAGVASGEARSVETSFMKFAAELGEEDRAPAMLDCKLTPWKRLKPITGSVEEYIAEHWSRKIPRAYEQLLHAAMEAGDVRMSLSILMAMTAMSPLTPARLKQLAHNAIVPLPSDVDLSHISDEDLELMLAGKKPIDLRPPKGDVSPLKKG